ncbi:MAG: DUF4956 domain-containing protein [Bacteroidales bacterium]|uniref:DUF4956 domain-containing protein n=1 Tax=Candidatus Cryptobacteroides sp. TaxID=2952915 RepID=UPI002A74ABF5|nr:DUF4956 domain-containing protein [Candidatus Cryptobacteroides sp.]MDD5915391.1 DUF4956 domain-containing protein [Bacteroidales bacterium]MDD7234398.1 DUF4956 domain-containing protein [Bacteroidales bacterium]MDY2700964.1 DUF4956 domain-containing protein [Candidatus Cryptobacteroides sp.]
MKRLLTVLTTVLMMLGLCFPAYSQIETSSAEEAGAVIGQTEDPFVGADFDPQIAAENGYSIEMTEEGDYKITQGAAGILEAVLNLVKIFFFNLLVSFLIIQFFYYPKSRRMDYYFTFMMFSSAMCLLLFLMNNLSLEIGFTLGLFAIFGMIRYRTETVPVREMTYLFIIIAVSVINGIGADVPFLELVAANVLIILLIWLLESRGVFVRRTSVKLIIYDRVDLILPERRDELVEDLRKRTGLDIRDIEIGQVDFLKDTAWIKVTYELPAGQVNTIDKLTRTKDFNA